MEQRIRFFIDHGRFRVTNGTDLRPWLEHPAWKHLPTSNGQSSMAGLQQPGSAWLTATNMPSGSVQRTPLVTSSPIDQLNDGTLTSWEVNALATPNCFTHSATKTTSLAVGLFGRSVKQLIRLEDDGNASWLTSIAPASGDRRVLARACGVHHRIRYCLGVRRRDQQQRTSFVDDEHRERNFTQLDEEILAPGAQVGVANTGERLFFDCVTPSSGTEMCVTDGTPGGSNVFHDLTPGVLSSDIRGLVAVGDGAALVSDGVTNGDAVGVSLWMIEGDELHMAYNPWPGTGNSSQALAYGSMTLTDCSFSLSHTMENSVTNGTDGVMVNCPMTGSSLTAERNDMFSANAIGARHADHIILGCLLLDREGLPAGKTHHCIGLLELGIHRNTLIEDKTIPLPVVTTNGLEITQHTAFELFHVREPCVDHDGGLLTPYPTGAEHHDGFVFHGCW